MTPLPQHPESIGTRADDYMGAYYASHLGGDEYDWSSESWRSFFTRAATRLVALTSATNVLDVGCAKGLLVQAFATVGADASGFDHSAHAIESAHPDVRAKLYVASATAPIEGRFDLVTCVEVLEHMSPTDAELAIDSMCAATDLILFSSTPTDFEEPSHVNVRPTPDWAASFAERGFFRRTDVSVDFLTGWALLLERHDLTRRDVVHRYESQYVSLHTEVLEKRLALLESHRLLAQSMVETDGSEADAEVRLRHDLADATGENARLDGELAYEREQAELLREDLAAREADVERLQQQLSNTVTRLRSRARRVRQLQRRLQRQRRRTVSLRRRLRAVTSSRTWRLHARVARLLRR
ncbi:class I SAM-dependent methyltransferase [Nocardioides sp. InS609-2]|uniref:class I SAM-dependent methyltransferase n=1 Tax=Nocardioides sp. InS609-2 TaxID=2760705 RepID=UPI0020C06482|nr:class I SAM-dependent methyltransferase [Nocardioides sp. InS609-2]